MATFITLSLTKDTALLRNSSGMDSMIFVLSAFPNGEDVSLKISRERYCMKLPTVRNFFRSGRTPAK